MLPKRHRRLTARYHLVDDGFDVMAASISLSQAAASALSAFLRGAERRAVVVAELQTGDPLVAERAVEASMRAFTTHAATLTMADWPTRFWRLLCSNPQLRVPDPGYWPAPVSHLQHLPAADRLALLLRIGAGLDEANAADVLGIDADDYRTALAQACPQDAQGYPDAVAWRALAEQVQLRVRDVPEARLQYLSQARESALGAMPQTEPAATTVSMPTPERREAAKPRRPRRPSARSRRWLWPTVVAATLLLAAAGWWWRSGGGAALLAAEDENPRDGVVIDAGPVQVEELRPTGGPASSATADSHADEDRAMLADPDLDVARDADFHAWFAAGGPIPVDESQPQPTRSVTATIGLETVDGDE